MNSMMAEDHYYMKLALATANQGALRGEIPVGALVVDDGKVIARAHNSVEAAHDATAHAELNVLQAACRIKEVKYLKTCSLYATLEPCPMCAMAAYWTQIGRVVFGASDEKRGYQRISPCLLHPKTVIQEGVYAEESKGLLQRFFEKLRK